MENYGNIFDAISKKENNNNLNLITKIRESKKVVLRVDDLKTGLVSNLKSKTKLNLNSFSQKYNIDLKIDFKSFKSKSDIIDYKNIREEILILLENFLFLYEGFLQELNSLKNESLLININADYIELSLIKTDYGNESQSCVNHIKDGVFSIVWDEVEDTKSSVLNPRKFSNHLVKINNEIKTYDNTYSSQISFILDLVLYNKNISIDKLLGNYYFEYSKLEDIFNYLSVNRYRLRNYDLLYLIDLFDFLLYAYEFKISFLDYEGLEYDYKFILNKLADLDSIEEAIYDLETNEDLIEEIEEKINYNNDIKVEILDFIDDVVAGKENLLLKKYDEEFLKFLEFLKSNSLEKSKFKNDKFILDVNEAILGGMFPGRKTFLSDLSNFIDFFDFINSGVFISLSSFEIKHNILALTNNFSIDLYLKKSQQNNEFYTGMKEAFKSLIKAKNEELFAQKESYSSNLQSINSQNNINSKRDIIYDVKIVFDENQEKLVEIESDFIDIISSLELDLDLPIAEVLNKNNLKIKLSRLHNFILENKKYFYLEDLFINEDINYGEDIIDLVEGLFFANPRNTFLDIKKDLNITSYKMFHIRNTFSYFIEKMKNGDF